MYIDRNSMFYGANARTFELANRLRKNYTQAECILWSKLKNREIFKVKFRRQHPAGIYIIDFYCHEYKLAVELNGVIHVVDNNPERDLNRTSELERMGIKVIRFSNNEVFDDIDQVISTIKKELT